MERLYGHNISHLERSIWNFRHKHSDYFDVLRFKYESKYKLYNSINLTEFYATTTPVYHVFHCHMKSIECHLKWKMKQTSFGSCITLNPNEIYFQNFKNHKAEKTLAKNTKNKFSSMFELMIDAEKPPTAHQIKELDFIVGFNESDLTFGWKGLKNSLMLYYSEPDEELVTQGIDV